jgi:hypothetical protein
MLRKIVSGGQTGADRAALDVALAWQVPIGGWVPKGRAAEDGKLPDRYTGISEAETDNPEERTRKNVEESDGTLIVSHGVLQGGSRLTQDVARELGKTCLHVDLLHTPIGVAVDQITAWADGGRLSTLNVAGPRGSEDSSIYQDCCLVLAGVLAANARLTPDESDDNDIAIALHGEVMNNFRHWDTIRWQVPAWYVAIAAGVLTISSAVTPARIFWGAVALSVFGFLCVWLQSRLVRYHIHGLNAFEQKVQKLRIAPRKIAALRLELPFDFSGRWALLRTATFGLPSSRCCLPSRWRSSRLQLQTSEQAPISPRP